MNFLKKLLGAAAIFAAIGSLGVIAQTVAIPKVVAIGASDLFADVVNGAPGPGNAYVSAGQIAGIEAYSYQVPVTAFAITAPNAVSLLYLNPTGTLATGTLTLMASPGDGQKFCVEDTQTQTAITVAANTGQTISTIGLGAVTALTANTRYCWLYMTSLSAWVRTI